MKKEDYIKIINENKNITYKEIIEKFECDKCNRCKNKKLIDTCCISLNLASQIWNG